MSLLLSTRQLRILALVYSFGGREVTIRELHEVLLREEPAFDRRTLGSHLISLEESGYLKVEKRREAVQEDGNRRGRIVLYYSPTSPAYVVWNREADQLLDLLPQPVIEQLAKRAIRRLDPRRARLLASKTAPVRGT